MIAKKYPVYIRDKRYTAILSEEADNWGIYPVVRLYRGRLRILKKYEKRIGDVESYVEAVKKTVASYEKNILEEKDRCEYLKKELADWDGR